MDGKILPPHHSSAQAARVRQSRLWIVALIFCISLCLAAAAILWRQRSDAVGSEARELGLLSLALTDEIDRGLMGVIDGLRGVQVELREGRQVVSAPDAEQILKARAALMPLVKVLWLVDQDGHVMVRSAPMAPPDLRSFTPALSQSGIGFTAVSRPFGDVGPEQRIVALGMDFVTPRGIRGWLIAGIPQNALLGAFSLVTPAPDARMAVFRSDGASLAGSIFTTPVLDDAKVELRLADLRNATLHRFHDGSERLVALHRLPHFGIELALTRDLAKLLVGWREAVRLTGVGVALVLIIMAGAVFLIRRADQRQLAAQQALQAQQQRATKLQSLGILAGSVAHDFNNLLALILGYCEMAHDQAPAKSNQARHLDKLMNAALRGQAVVERILTFSRGGSRTLAVFELEPMVAEILSLLAPRHPNVAFTRHFGAPGAHLRGDATQVYEAVMNLCVNALQAMPDGGVLDVTLRRLTVTAPRVLSHSKLRAGRYAVLAVSDQGVGISPESMERLFEPFFTTRGNSGGNGLGLAVVHGVVAEMGGSVHVESTLLKGSRFTLYLPESSEAREAASLPQTAEPRGEGQRLLIVDDDPQMVALNVQMLSGLGYRPVGFSDARSALKAACDDPDGFAAVITDEVMPDMGGIQFAEALGAFAPHAPVLLVSGFGGPQLAVRAQQAGVARLLGKPVRRAELARVLAELLS